MNPISRINFKKNLKLNKLKESNETELLSVTEDYT